MILPSSSSVFCFRFFLDFEFFFSLSSCCSSINWVTMEQKIAKVKSVLWENRGPTIHLLGLLKITERINHYQRRLNQEFHTTGK